MIYRHVFQRSRNAPGIRFLEQRLEGAVGYDRIAGYFDTSLFELAGEALEKVQGPIRIVCNSDIRADDLKSATHLVCDQAQRLSFFKQSPDILSKRGTDRIDRLFRILSGQITAKLEVRILPDDVFGLIHGKAGVIRYANGKRTSFLGSVNETLAGWALNYELVWEDDSNEACDWVQQEFDKLWTHPLTQPLSIGVVKEIQRLSKRVEISLTDWKIHKDPSSIVIETPVYREQFGLWPHQKSFVAQAWKAHQVHGARFILADQVGLGKTVQLGMVAQLIALSSGKPVLALIPKTLMEQWQVELWDLLQIPTARLEGHAWIDEEGVEYPLRNREHIGACPRRIGLISQGLVTHNPEALQSLLEQQWSCVIVDEAHRARRRRIPSPQERGSRILNPEMECNRLYAFLFKLAAKTDSMFLATATPMQLHPIEVWDLLYLLSHNNPHVLGDVGSYWLDPERALPIMVGESSLPEAIEEAWPWMKNPFPPSWESPDARYIRTQLQMDDRTAVCRYSFQDLRTAQKTIVKSLHTVFADKHLPFVRSIVRRTRAYLESNINPQTNEPYLASIGVELYGEDDPIPLSGYLAHAYERAEQFCLTLAQRIQGSGFLKTLLLRRIGSSIEAGKHTVESMLSRSDTPFSEDDEDTPNTIVEAERATNTLSDLYPLTIEETRMLQECAAILVTSQEEDPKWEVIYTYLHEKGWIQEGCVLFSQYFDTAAWMARKISKAYPTLPVGLYAGAQKSILLLQGHEIKKDREELKRMVKERDLTILVGTDAASEGLNLQTLGTLINIDLPWNPTKLEQRKGRIQRIGQKRKTVKILNLRYKDSVEDKVHQVLANRLQDMYRLFGQIPDVVEDVWIDIALGQVEKARTELDALPKHNPFDERYSRIEQVDDWETCATVVNKAEKLQILRQGW